MSIAHFTLATRDVVSTRKFFTHTMGWEAIEQPGNIDMESAWLRIAPGQELHLLHIPDFVASNFEHEFGRHFAIAYPSDGFAALKQRLANCGAELIEPLRATPFERFFFRDPNGYVFEVVDANRSPEM